MKPKSKPRPAPTPKAVAVAAMLRKPATLKKATRK